MNIQQFVMAYQVEQDRLRAMLPDGFTSLRPVLRINAEIRDGEGTYLEWNTPVEGFGKRGWLNIARWDSGFAYERSGRATTFQSPFLTITYTGVGVEGGCPAEKDNEGCFYREGFVAAETIDRNKEYCDCAFAWNFPEGKARGESRGDKSLPAIPEEVQNQYERVPLTPEHAAAIPCKQVLGAYQVRFER